MHLDPILPLHRQQMLLDVSYKPGEFYVKTQKCKPDASAEVVKICERDIKCANILVDASGSVKLADFGLAKEISKFNWARSCKGTVYWMAPEVVKAKPYEPSADIWSLGCTVLELLTRRPPYPNLEWIEAFYKIGHGELPDIPNSLSEEARDFIKKCLRFNPDDRPTAAQLLKHPFVKQSRRDSTGSRQFSPMTAGSRLQ